MPKDFYKDVKISKNFDKNLVKKAFLFSKKAHDNQKRKSGEPYITHPLSVARILLELGMGHKVVAAALLHDVIEDTEFTLEDIKKEFGDDLGNLVLGVTNLTKVDFSAHSNPDDIKQAKVHAKNENLRSLFMAMSEDVRVVIIKLADRLHNMQTIKALPPKDQKRISLETLNIFSPIALRLGMGEFKGILEDLAFPIAYPEEFKRVEKEANRRYKAADRYVLKVKRLISDELKKNSVAGKVEGRAKHIYSLYKKLIRPDIEWDFDKIYDLVAIRIITKKTDDCYKVLGIIHSLFRPVPDKVKDYIAAPKPNGYRSIHTTVFGPDSKIVEIQIRTQEMHDEAEFGVASHLHYTEQKLSGRSSEELDAGHIYASSKQTDFLRQIKSWQDSVENYDEYLEGLKLEFLDDRIYVFSPKGDIFDLPVGATPVDFAYEIHSDIGNAYVGAKVNGKIAQIDTELKTRDVVQIITQKHASPKRGWLDFVKTTKAKHHIRSYFRKFDFENNQVEGEKILKNFLAKIGEDINLLPEARVLNNIRKETSFKDLPSLYASVGEGLTIPRQAAKIILGRQIIKETEKKRILGTGKPQNDNLSGMKVKIGTCCNPKKNDDIVCYITRGEGLTVHKRSCKNVKNLEKDRLINFNPWKSENTIMHIEIISKDRIGLIRDIADIFMRRGYNIENISNNHDEKDKTKISVTLNIRPGEDYIDLLSEIAKVEGVETVKRQ